MRGFAEVALKDSSLPLIDLSTNPSDLPIGLQRWKDDAVGRGGSMIESAVSMLTTAIES